MKKILMSVMVLIGVVSAVAIGGTRAFFSDAETSTGNTFTAGAIDLQIDNVSYYNGVLNASTTWELRDLTVEKFFDFQDLKPGDRGEDTISLHVNSNDAYLCANVKLTSNDDNGLNEPEGLVDITDGAGNGELAGLVNFMWWADDGDNVLESDEGVISQGPIGVLGVGGSTTISLADSENNIWTGTGGPMLGNVTHYIGKAWCFGTLTVSPLPQDGLGTTSPRTPANSTGGISCDGSLLGNETQTDSLTADVTFTAEQARHNDAFLCAPREMVPCDPEEQYADNVVSFNQGVRKDGSTINADRTDPTKALGAPQSLGAPFDNPVPTGQFFSLGFDEEGDDTEGGWIIVEFTNNVIVDGPGNDLRMWEVTGGTSYPVEKLKIEVSQDGTNWFVVASSVNRDAEADIATSGLAWAKFVRLTDVSVRGEFEPIADGYDLDAFSALNCTQSK